MADDRIAELEKWRLEMERKFGEAFPAADYIGHCRYHQIMIEQLEERRRLRRAVVEKTIAGLVWGALIGLGIAVWQYLRTMLK